MLTAALTGCSVTQQFAQGSETAASARAVATVAATVAPTATPLPIPTPSPMPDPPATLRLALQGLPDTLDPLHTRGVSGEALAGLLFSGLTRADEDGRPLPDLAQSWDVTEQGAQWDVHLSPDARWHDGMPVTADDVLFTLTRARSSPASTLWEGITAERLDVETARFHVPRDRVGMFLALATLPLLPSHALLTPQDEQQFQIAPVGTGPYRLIRIDAQGADLARVPALVPHGPNVAAIHVIFTSGPDAALKAMQDGTADLALLSPQPSDIPASLPGIDLLRPVRAAETVVLLNCRRAPFSDVRVRSALWSAIDRQEIVQSVLHGFGRATSDPLPLVSEGDGAAGRPFTPPSSNPAMAGQLLDEAGWSNAGQGSARHSSAGKPLAMSLLTTDDPERRQVAQRVAAQLGAVGVAATVESVGEEGLFRDFLGRGQFDAAIIGLAWSLPDAQPETWWRSPGGVPSADNFSGIVDGALEDALARAAAEPDETARAADLRSFETRFAAVVPAIPLYRPLWLVAVSSRLSGISWGWVATAGDLVASADRWRLSAS